MRTLDRPAAVGLLWSACLLALHFTIPATVGAAGKCSTLLVSFQFEFDFGPPFWFAVMHTNPLHPASARIIVQPGCRFDYGK